MKLIIHGFTEYDKREYRSKAEIEKEKKLLIS